jgi:hypothetical protein
VRENRTHGSMRRREATPDQSATPLGPRTPPADPTYQPRRGPARSRRFTSALSSRAPEAGARWSRPVRRRCSSGHDPFRPTFTLRFTGLRKRGAWASRSPCYGPHVSLWSPASANRAALRRLDQSTLCARHPGRALRSVRESAEHSGTQVAPNPPKERHFSAYAHSRVDGSCVLAAMNARAGAGFREVRLVTFPATGDLPLGYPGRVRPCRRKW